MGLSFQTGGHMFDSPHTHTQIESWATTLLPSRINPQIPQCRLGWAHMLLNTTLTVSRALHLKSTSLFQYEESTRDLNYIKSSLDRGPSWVHKYGAWSFRSAAVHLSLTTLSNNKNTFWWQTLKNVKTFSKNQERIERLKDPICPILKHFYLVLSND